MIGEDDVRYVAKLARLHLEQDEVARMTGELAKILAHIDKMSELDMADVPTHRPRPRRGERDAPRQASAEPFACETPSATPQR